jgi:hypothetical protein
MKKTNAQLSNWMWEDGQSCQRVFRAAGWLAYMAIRACPAAVQTTDLRQGVLSSWQND